MPRTKENAPGQEGRGSGAFEAPEKRLKATTAAVDC